MGCLRNCLRQAAGPLLVSGNLGTWGLQSSEPPELNGPSFQWHVFGFDREGVAWSRGVCVLSGGPGSTESTEIHCPRGRPEAPETLTFAPTNPKAALLRLDTGGGCASALRMEKPCPHPLLQPPWTPAIQAAGCLFSDRHLMSISFHPQRPLTGAEIKPHSINSVHLNLISRLLTPKPIITKLCPFHRAEKTQAQRCSLACGHCAPDTKPWSGSTSL